MPIDPTTTEDFDAVRNLLALPAQFAEQLPESIRLLVLALPSGVAFYDTLFALATRLAASDHRQGRRRREALASPELRRAFDELKKLLPLKVVAIVGGEWLTGPPHQPDQDFECWQHPPQDYRGETARALEVESLTLTASGSPEERREKREQARLQVLTIAQEHLRRDPPLDHKGPLEMLFEYSSTAKGAVEALICDLSSEGERSALILGVFDCPLDVEQARLARMYFRVLLFASTLLIRAERFRDHNDELAKALQELGSFRSRRPSTNDMTLAGYVVRPARQFLATACKLGCKLFELAELRIYLPVAHEGRIAQCAASMGTRTHISQQSADGESTDVASCLMWHSRNTTKAHGSGHTVKRWAFHHLEQLPNLPSPSAGTHTFCLPGWAQYNLSPWDPASSIHTALALDGVMLPEQREAIHRGPTIVLCTPPPAAPDTDATRPPLYETEGVFLMMLMGRSAGREWVNIEGTSSIHASRVTRMEIFFNVVYHAFYSLLESRVREWCASAALEIRKLVDDGREQCQEEDDDDDDDQATEGETAEAETTPAPTPLTTKTKEEAKRERERKRRRRRQAQRKRRLRHCIDLCRTLANRLQGRLGVTAVSFYRPDATPMTNRFALELLARWPEGSDEPQTLEFWGPIPDSCTLPVVSDSPGTIFVQIRRRRRLVAVVRLDGVRSLFEIGAGEEVRPGPLPGHLEEVIRDIERPMGSVLFETLTDRVIRLLERYADPALQWKVPASEKEAAATHLRGLLVDLDGFPDDGVTNTAAANQYGTGRTHIRNKIAELRDAGFTIPIEFHG